MVQNEIIQNSFMVSARFIGLFFLATLVIWEHLLFLLDIRDIRGPHVYYTDVLWQNEPLPLLFHFHIDVITKHNPLLNLHHSSFPHQTPVFNGFEIFVKVLMDLLSHVLSHVVHFLFFVYANDVLHSLPLVSVFIPDQMLRSGRLNWFLRSIIIW